MNNNVANECKINLEKKLFRQKRVAIFEACLPSLQNQHWTHLSVASSAGPNGITFWQMVWGLPACRARGDFILHFSVLPTHL